MFHIKTRTYTLLVILYLLFINFPLAFSSEEDSLDLEIILSGIQYYDSLIKSGEGDVTYRQIIAFTPRGSKIPKGKMPEMREETHKYHLTFHRHKTRMDIPEHFVGKLHFSKRTVITDEKGEWVTTYHDDHISGYHYSTKSSLAYMDWDPRILLKIPWRSKGTVYKYLKKKKFKVKQKESVRRIECYRLETPDGKERIWITPDLGFRFLKYERETKSRGVPGWVEMKKGTPLVTRRRVYYKKYGEAWFPKKAIREWFFIDEKGQERRTEREQYELKNFRLNHDIPEKKFTIEIPEDTQIWVADLRTFMSKKKFLKYYNMK